MSEKKDKIYRVLNIYTMLMNGEVLNKNKLADRYGVNERSIQRDIDDIRSYLNSEATDTGIYNYIIYDRKEKGFRIENIYRMKLTNPEVLAVSKILLDSRAFKKEQMEDLLDRLIKCCVPKKNERLVSGLINNEKFHYVELKHKTDFLDTMWQIGQAISKSKYIKIQYYKPREKDIVERKLKPLAIMFDEYYFYLIAFIGDEELREKFDLINESLPTIYRMDRIKSLEILPERFHIPYRDRFEEGEFRKRIQFMYGGKLKNIRFKYKGYYLEAVLDRLPTAKVIDEKDGIYTLKAEVFGNGIDMWLRSQGELVEVL